MFNSVFSAVETEKLKSFALSASNQLSSTYELIKHNTIKATQIIKSNIHAKLNTNNNNNTSGIADNSTESLLHVHHLNSSNDSPRGLIRSVDLSITRITSINGNGQHIQSPSPIHSKRVLTHNQLFQTSNSSATEPVISNRLMVQTQIEMKQDTILNDMQATIDRLFTVSNHINSELKLHSAMLDDGSEELAAAQTSMQLAQKRVGQLLQKSKISHFQCIFALSALIIILFILIIYF